MGVTSIRLQSILIPADPHMLQLCPQVQGTRPSSQIQQHFSIKWSQIGTLMQTLSRSPQSLPSSLAWKLSSSASTTNSQHWCDIPNGRFADYTQDP